MRVSATMRTAISGGTTTCAVRSDAGDWERAVELAEGEIRADLDWLIELERLVGRRPAQQNRRLRNGERDRLEKLLDTVQKRPPRKRSANGG